MKKQLIWTSLFLASATGVVVVKMYEEEKQEQASASLPCRSPGDLYQRLTGPWRDPAFRERLSLLTLEIPSLASVQAVYGDTVVQSLHRNLCVSTDVSQNIVLRPKPGRAATYQAILDQVASDRYSVATAIGPEWARVEEEWRRWLKAE